MDIVKDIADIMRKYKNRHWKVSIDNLNLTIWIEPDTEDCEHDYENWIKIVYEYWQFNEPYLSMRRNVGRRALEHLEQRLLNALARDIAGDGRIFALARDLVDLIDIDDAVLGQLDVEVRRLDQTEQDVLDILADIAGLGQRRRVRDGERDLKRLGERLRKQCLARAGRAEHQNIRLLKLHLGLGMVDTLVMVVNGNGERDLGAILADHVLIEHVFQLLRRRQMLRPCRSHLTAVLLGHEVQFILQNAGANANALIADIHARTRDQLAYPVLGFAAEGALQRLFIFIIRHTAPLFSRISSMLIENLVDQPVLDSLLRGHEVIALAVGVNGLERLAGVLGQDARHALLDDLETLEVKRHVRDLTLRAGGRLMDHDLSVRQRIALALCAGGQQKRTHGRCHADADGRNVALDIVHGVVDRHACGDRAAGAVDIQRNVLVRVLRLQIQKLRNNERCGGVVDLLAQHNDAVIQQTGVDVERTLAAAGLLDYHWD